MHERDEILAMLLVAGFFGTSFWPVVCGWVDLGTVAGWLELGANFGTVLLVSGVFGSIGAAGFMAACLLRWCLHGSGSSRSLPLRIRLRPFIDRVWIVAFWAVVRAARLIGWATMLRRREPPIAERGPRDEPVRYR